VPVASTGAPAGGAQDFVEIDGRLIPVPPEESLGDLGPAALLQPGNEALMGPNRIRVRIASVDDLPSGAKSVRVETLEGPGKGQVGQVDPAHLVPVEGVTNAINPTQSLPGTQDQLLGSQSEQTLQGTQAGPEAPTTINQVDPEYTTALDIANEYGSMGKGRITAKILQQNMGINPHQAEELLSRMEADGLVGPAERGGRKWLGGDIRKRGTRSASLAPRRPAPIFYSQLARSIGSLPQNTYQANQVMGALSKQPIKAAEVKWTGLDEWLAAKGNSKVTKQEMLDYIREHEVDIREVTLGDMAESPEVSSFIDEMTSRYGGSRSIWRVHSDYEYSPLEIPHEAGVPNPDSLDYDDPQVRSDIARWHELAKTSTPSSGSTIYPSYIQPFQPSSNYRELLLTLNRRDQGLPPGYRVEPMSGDNTWSHMYRVVNEQGESIVTGQTEADVLRRFRAQQGTADYQSGHWADVPNVVAHVRFDDRDIAGKKTLFIQELQSDWAQGAHSEHVNNVKILAAKYSIPHDGKLGGKEMRRVVDELNKVATPSEVAKLESKGFRVPTSTDDLKILKAKEDEYEALKAEREALLNRLDGLLSQDVESRRRHAAEISQAYISQTTINENMARLRMEIMNLRSTHNEGVPSMPFKGDDWINLAMKRMVRYAAENGYDAIAWTTGAHQAERYNALVRNVESITYDGKSQLHFVTASGERRHADGVTWDNMAQHIGAENVEKLRESKSSGKFPFNWEDTEPDTSMLFYNNRNMYIRRNDNRGVWEVIDPERGIPVGGATTRSHAKEIAEQYLGANSSNVADVYKLSGQDLTVRTSMTGKDAVYDQMAVQSAKALGKKFGSTVEQVDMPIKPGEIGAEPVHYMPITPEMRESVIYQGQPQFMPTPNQSLYGPQDGLNVPSMAPTSEYPLPVGRLKIYETDSPSRGWENNHHILRYLHRQPYVTDLAVAIKGLHDKLHPMVAKIAQEAGVYFRPSQFVGLDSNPSIYGIHALGITNQIAINPWSIATNEDLGTADQLVSTMLHELAHNSYRHGAEEPDFQAFLDLVLDELPPISELAPEINGLVGPLIDKLSEDGFYVLDYLQRMGVNIFDNLSTATFSSRNAPRSIDGGQPQSSTGLSGLGSLTRDAQSATPPAGTQGAAPAGAGPIPPTGPAQPAATGASGLTREAINQLFPDMADSDVTTLLNHQQIITKVYSQVIDDRARITDELTRLADAGYINPADIPNMSLQEAIKKLDSLAQDPATRVNRKEWSALAKRYHDVGDILMRDPTGLVGQLIIDPVREAMGANKGFKLPHQWASRPAMGALLGYLLNPDDPVSGMTYLGIAGASTHPAARAIFKNLALATARFPILNAFDALVFRNPSHGVPLVTNLERVVKKLGNIPHEVARAHMSGFKEGSPVTELDVNRGAFSGVPIQARMAVGAVAGAAFPQDESDGRIRSGLAGAAIGAAIPSWSSLTKRIAAETERIARTSAWAKGKGDHMKAQYPAFRGRLLAAIPNPTTKTQVAALLDGEEGQFTPEHLANVLQSKNINPATIDKFTKQWANISYFGDRKGVELAGHIQFDYKYTNADEFLKELVPFHFYATRNLPYYAEHMAKNPVIANIILRTNEQSEDLRKEMGLTNRFLGMLMLNDNLSKTIAEFLVGRPGMTGVDLLPVLLSVVQQTREPAEWAGENTAAKALNWGGLIGLSPYPGYAAALQASGITGAKPGPNILPLTNYARNLPYNFGVDVERPLRELGAKVQGQTLNATIDPDAITNSKIRARIAEMATEAGEPGAFDQYMDAVDSPLWQRAKEQVQQEASATSSLGFILPIRPKFLSETERLVRESRAKNFPAADPAADASAPPTAEYLEAYGRAAQEHPEGTTYSSVYQTPAKRSLALAGREFESLATPEEMATFREVQAAYSAGYDPKYTPDQQAKYREVLDKELPPAAKALYDRISAMRSNWLADPANAEYAAYWKRNADEAARGNQLYNIDAYLAETGKSSSTFDLNTNQSPASHEQEVANVQTGQLTYQLKDQLSEYMDFQDKNWMWMHMPSGARWREGYLSKHPLLQAYFNWKSATSTSDPAADTSVDAFIRAYNANKQPTK
jgi:hypothetical protein